MQLRDRYISVRLKESEYTKLRELAESADVSISEFLRHRALDPQDRPVIVADAKKVRELFVQLKKIGSNLNQLAFRMNQKGSYAIETEALKSAIDQVSYAAGATAAFVEEIRDSY